MDETNASVIDPFQDQANRALALSLAVQGKALAGTETVQAAQLYYDFLNGTPAE